jgi:CRISPR-associated protein Cmr6
MKDAYQRIPLMFRAQVDGRAQIQYLDPEISKDPNQQQDAEIWADEWVDAVEENVPKFSDNVQTKSYQITWRFITNSGQDEGVTRPVIGANGFPYYPGSSMKGAFLRACPREDRIKYCGGNVGNDTHPGILRFHGAYPQDLDWIEDDIVDIVHPQEKWQSQTLETHRKPRGESGFIQMSLYQPTLTFGISANQNLPETEWETIWNIWEKALSQGIGTRVSAGYGQVKLNRENRQNILLSVSLKGQGLASTLIDKTTSEFRPNGFKAALRGHTMRLLGGVTDAQTAERLTKQLWGGFAGRDGAIVGELGIAFDAVDGVDLELDTFTYTPGRNPQQIPIYDLNNGILDILVMGNLAEERKTNLTNFVKKLMQFSLLLGGFGKSWRRVDHRLFFEEYLEDDDKPM